MNEYIVEWVDPEGWLAMLAAAMLEDAIALAMQGENRGEWKADKIKVGAEIFLGGEDLQDMLSRYALSVNFSSLNYQSESHRNVKSW